MKKLLLILSAVLVSAISLGQSLDPNSGWPHLNPFAYDLKSEVKNDGTIDLIFSLNANAVPSDGGGKTYERLNNENRGVQIYILDEHETVVHTIPVPSNQINKGTHTINLNYDDIPETYWGKPLHWKVTVWGNKGRTEQKQILKFSAINAASNFYPKNVHGIAIEKNPANPHFGKIFITESATTAKTGRNSLLEYDMQLKYKARHHKDFLDYVESYFSATEDYEPHRVKISDDGRIFVTSYHTSAGVSVFEYMGNGEFRTIITCGSGWYLYNNDANSLQYSRRAIDMDVRGSGDNLKMIVAWMIPKYQQKSSQWHARIVVKEYSIGTGNLNINPSTGGTDVAIYDDRNSGSGYKGWLFQAYEGAWQMAKHGFIGVTYDTDGDIWMKIDYAMGAAWLGEIHLFKRGSTSPYDSFYQAQHTGDTPSQIYGANGIRIIKEKGKEKYTLITGYDTDKFQKFTINNKNSKPVLTLQGAYTQNGDGSNRIVGMAEDYAGNLYFLNNRGDQTNDDNVVVFAMPYDGKRETTSQGTFVIGNPTPNILATDLRFAPVPKQPKYRFSFNVNTTPEIAQIRFYKSYGDGGENDMKKNLAKINADDYQGGNEITPSFVYNIPEGLLKQGEIAVEFDMVGGKVVDGVLNDAALPRGEWYWSVYVEAPRKSSVFAPIYKQDNNGEDTHYRLHATVNNYPETDGFGHIYAAQYNNTLNPAKKSLMVYNFNPTGYCNDEQGDILSSTRYKLVNEFVNPSGEKTKFENQRRLAVAPDGKVYIADHGLTDQTQYQNKTWAERPMVFINGGIYVWDPKSQKGNEIQLQQFLNNKTETSSGVAIWNHGGNLKLYGMNTYGEFGFHTGGADPNNALKWKDYEYSPDNQNNINIYGWNGFKEYALGTLDNILLNEANGTSQHSLLKGDAGGNTSIVAMDKGIWICQHRENDVQYTIDQFLNDRTKTQALPDNTENYILSFVPYNSSTREWKSCTTKGINFSKKDENTKEYKEFDLKEACELTQQRNSPVQSAPGAGMTYRKINGVDYIFMIKHTGEIAQLKVTWSGNTPTVTYVRDYPSIGTKTVVPGTKRPTGTITSMCFDYAGNLITTAGKTYFDDGQDIIVYTMPYDRVNAREIQAPNSCRMIPERIAQLDMNKEDLDELIEEHQRDHLTGCAIDLYRPLQGGMFNTICLPCTLDLKTLPEGHPLYEAELKEYTGLNLNTVGGEKVLELVFTDVSDKVIIANEPYIIEPKDDYNSIIRFAGPLRLTNTTGEAVYHEENSKNYNITYQGIIPYQEITPFVQDGVSLTLMLVSDNRLAEMTTRGYMYGFRGYFNLNTPLKGIKARITNSKGTTTNTTIVVDGKKVNVEKFLQEGRVYIRMGDSLYTIDGQKVE